MTDTSYTRISALLRGRRDVRVMQMPGIDVATAEIQIGVRILSDEKMDECRIDAVKYFQGKSDKMGMPLEMYLRIDPMILEREIERNVIFSAFVKPGEIKDGEPVPFFPSATAVRQLDSVLVKTLFEIYDEQQDYVNPQRAASIEELRELADEVGKGPRAEATLQRYDAPSLRTLVHTLGAELQTLLAGRSGTGTPAEST